MTHPTNPIIDEAEQALRHFGAIDRDNARDLLRMWTYAAELGDAERDAVLARFPQPAAPRLDRAAA